jgi:hypothetical protein
MHTHLPTSGALGTAAPHFHYLVTSQLRRDLPSAARLEYDRVSRRVNQPVAWLGDALERLPPVIGELRLDGPFVASQDGSRYASWRANGRFRWRGLRRHVRVELSLHAWSRDSSELTVRPRTRRIAGWGASGQRRYFALAHTHADELVRWLDAAARTARTARDVGDTAPARVPADAAAV